MIIKKTVGTTWMGATFLVSFASFGWQGFAKINQSQNMGVSLAGGFFSGFAPALVTCLFSLQVLNFFADEQRSKKPLFGLLLVIMALSFGQWKTMPEVNGLNAAFLQDFDSSDHTLEVLQWSILPLLLLIRSVNSFSTIAWSDAKPAEAKALTSKQKCLKWLAFAPAAVLSGTLGYSISGGVTKAIDAIPSELSYPVVHYATDIPAPVTAVAFTAFFLWQYTNPIVLGGEHLIHDIKRIRHLKSCFSSCKAATKTGLANAFLLTAILFPPIAQVFQSEAAGEDNIYILASAFWASLLINRSGMSLFFPQAHSEESPEMIEKAKALTFFPQIIEKLTCAETSSVPALGSEA